MTINIPEEMGKKLEEHVKTSSEFSSVDEYVEFVLSEVLKQTTGQQEDITEEQEEEVKKRLEDLGYLD